MNQKNSLKFASSVVMVLVSFFSWNYAEAVTVFSDDFSSHVAGDCIPDGTVFGSWTQVFGGFGCVKIESDGVDTWLHAQPKVPKGGNTHSSLVIGPSFSGNYTYGVNVNTVSQNREGRKSARPWEVGWVLWDYTDNVHFYYFVPKPNGWELGKEDPAYAGAQRFLATGTTPLFPIGEEYRVEVTQTSTDSLSTTMSVSVNGVHIVTFTDTERPYSAGNLGLYTEDAHVHFDDVLVDQ